MSGQTDAAYLFIRQKILDGEFKPAQKLTELQLSEAIGVSRNTVKKAPMKLEQERLVTFEENKGASIKSFTLDEVVNYLEIREVLEGLVARTVARDIRNEGLRDLSAILDKMAESQENSKLDEYSAGNRSFHGLIYSLAKNTQAVELINMISTQLIRYQFRTVLVPGRSLKSYQEHREIYEALKAHDEKRAETAIRTHVTNVRHTIQTNYHYLL